MTDLPRRGPARRGHRLPTWSPAARALVLSLVTAAFSGPAAASGQAPAPEGLTVTEIRIPELRHTDPALVLKSLYSRVGQPYGEYNMARDRERLDRLGIFSAISITPLREQGGIVLDLQLRETTPWLPLITADITDEDGLTAGPGLKAVNLFGTGTYLSAAARFGQAVTGELKTENPWLPGGNWIYSLTAYYRDRFNELEEFNENALDAELKVGRTRGRYLRAGARLGYQFLKSDVDGITLSGDNRDRIRELGLFAGYDSRDLWSETHRGWWAEMEVNRHGGPLGGDGDWWSLVLDLRRYQPLRVSHTLQVAAYTTLQFGEVDADIPEHRVFHIGGTNSVRGWGLGAREGKNELITTVEYRWNFLQPRVFSLFGFTAHLGAQCAVFGDAGIAWDGEDQFRADNLIGGGGVGLRLLVPYIKNIRFDVASGDRGTFVGVHVGAFEKVEKQRERVR